MKTPYFNPYQNNVKNFIINGNFDYWQRGFASTPSGGYWADRFICAEYLATGAANQARSSDVPSFSQSGYQSTYSLEMTVSTAQASPGATESGGFFYKMEGNIFKELYGKTFTLSFWIKSSVVGTFGVAFRNSAFDRTLVKEVTIYQANVWEKKSITVNHSTTGTWLFDNTVGMDIVWSFVCGSTYADGVDGVWNSSQKLATANCNMNLFTTIGNSIKISQVKLNLGSSSSVFNLFAENLVGELIRCQRYFEKTFDLDVAPASGLGGGSRMISCYPWSVTALTIGADWQFLVSKRTSDPTITTYNPYSVGSGWSRAGAGDYAADIYQIGQNGVCFRVNAAMTTGAAHLLHATANNEL